MKRRTILRTAAAAAVPGAVALAGCAGSGATDPGDGTITTTATTTTDPAFPTRVTGIAPDPVPGAFDAAIEVSLAQNFSADAPAELSVSVTNDTSETRTYQFGPVVPWSDVWGRHGSADATLVAVPGPVRETLGGGIVPTAPADGCWRATDGLALPEFLQRKDLEPGETVEHSYTLVGQHDDATCLPSGAYRFEDRDFLGRGRWGFDVRVAHGQDS